LDSANSANGVDGNDTIDRGVESDFIIGDNGNCDGNGGDDVTKSRGRRYQP
jgi:hypothetical protein